MTTTVFDETFRRATGWEPYDYQRELGARRRPPAVIEVPTGSGKTMAVLRQRSRRSGHAR